MDSIVGLKEDAEADEKEQSTGKLRETLAFYMMLSSSSVHYFGVEEEDNTIYTTIRKPS